MNISKKNKKLSVCVVTYNQEKFIEKCLQSIVDQVTDFDYEIIVGDDCSTDGTAEIVKNFAEKYPHLINAVLQKNNIGAHRNHLSVYELVKGEYIAHVDGDDYCLPGKLQAQVNFLDVNKNCSMVAHRLALLDGDKFVGLTRMNEESIGIDYLLKNHPAFLHSSIMIRSEARNSLPKKDWYIDFHIYIHACSFGKIGFQNQVLGVYRINIGISSKLNLLMSIFDAIEYADKLLDVQDKALIKWAKGKNALSYSFAYLLNKDYRKFEETINIAYSIKSKNKVVKLFYLLKKIPFVLRIIVLMYKKINK